MALVSEEGHYLRIRKIDYIPGERSAIRFVIYRSAESRRDGPGPFGAAQEGDVRTAEVTDALRATLVEGLSAGDALISAAYRYLRTLDRFQGWTDA
jgi:hypothetical protein